MKRLSLVVAILIVFTNTLFAQTKERKREHPEDVYVQLINSDFDLENNFLFLGLKDMEYMVVELGYCMPQIKIGTNIKGAMVKARANYQEYGTINQGTFYLADEALCQVQIIVKNRQQKLAWEKQIYDVAYLKVTPPKKN